MGRARRASDIEEIHEISKQPERKHERKTHATTSTEERIRVLEGQVTELLKQHKNLLEHVAELTKIVAEQIKESSEKE